MSELSEKSCVCIIGSSRLLHHESVKLCEILGRFLANLPNLVLLTGGVPGAGEVVGRSFHKRREYRGNNGDSDIFHILPHGSSSWNYGTTIFAGINNLERRAFLAKSADVFIVIEGRSGTAHEAFLAAERLATIIPISRLGGHAADIYPQTPRPHVVSAKDWEMIANTQVPVLCTAKAVARIVKVCLT